MLDAVTKLDPLFKMPYLAGAIALSVMTEDYKGASVIFDRGLEVYPKDWNLAYRASYHYLFDLHDTERAAKLLIQAADNGGPYWTRLLAVRLYSKQGQLTLGLSILESYRKTLKDEKQIKDIDRRIAALKREMRK
jgi:hypothetical protein